MLYDPTRHESLRQLAWSEDHARTAIGRIVTDAEQRFSADGYWPVHPLDAESGAAEPLTPLYYGALGTIWGLHHLRDVAGIRLSRDYQHCLEPLQQANRHWLGTEYEAWKASYLMGDTPFRLMKQAAVSAETDADDQLATLIAANIENPTRELMWGSPGTLLAALFLYERTGDERWAQAFRATGRTLWSQLSWSEDLACHYWTQDLYGSRSAYLDAVHGFVATAVPLIRGRALLGDREWKDWLECIVTTVRRTVMREDAHVNWPVYLIPPEGRPPRLLMQFCHGAPGFVVCLGDLPSTALDPLLHAAGETIWAAGPLTKGSNLCHGTGGNGYAFLKLYRRTGDRLWLDRARAFAMHGIVQTEADLQRYGQGRYSLWTGDTGFAIYLWHCLQGTAAFPTLDIF